ncbi:MAG: hypothetical protein OXC10_11375 [Rhodospirillaceae bacterium]|nr:hypothetical protein [Rhodospirillaceae bacterium]
MSATMVRTGGVMVFFLILAVLVTGFMLAGAMAGAGAGGVPDPARFGSTLSLTMIVYLAIMIFVYWTTKGLFNAFAYRRADTPIMTLMILMAINLALTLFGAGAPSAETGSPSGGGSAAFGIFSAIAVLATVMAWIWFSIAAIGFGTQVGSQLWKAIGIVYLVGTSLAFVGNGLLLSGIGGATGLILLIAGPVVLGGWVCHGIGLIIGAREMART